jgi:phosphonate transport system permease protein
MATACAPLAALHLRIERLQGVRRRARVATAAAVAGAVVLVAWSLHAIVVTDTDWSRVTLSGVARAVGRFAALDVAVLSELARPALDTALMATLGTLAGAVLALPVAWLGARNVTPAGGASYLLARGLMTMSRSVHEIVWALLFVAAAGLGSLAGVLALAVRSVGFVSKTVAEAIEDVDPGPVEAMRAVGATRLQVLRYAILPQVVPVVLGNLVFEWDINVRRATIMGLVGAGGLGLALFRQMAASSSGGISAVVVVILALILLGEVASHHARKALV